jgi:hypothetical protein
MFVIKFKNRTVQKMEWLNFLRKIYLLYTHITAQNKIFDP